MQRAALALSLALIAGGAVFFATRGADGGPTLPALPDARALDDDALRAAAREAGCAEGAALWFAVSDRSPDDLEALRAIAACARRGAGGELVDEASELLGRSRILRALPQVLDELELKDRLPILSRVEQEPLEPAELVDLGRVQRELGDLPGAIRSLRRALSLDPADGAARVQLAHDLVEAGDLSSARAGFREALELGAVPVGLGLGYAAGLGWPGAALLVLLGGVGLWAIPGVRWAHAPAAAWEVGARRLVLAGVLAVLAALAGRWLLAGDPVAYLQLVGLGALLAAWTLGVPLRRPLARFGARAREVAGRLVRGRLDHALDGVSVPAKVGLLLTGVVLLVGVAPAIGDVDVAALVALLALALIFSTVGSILLAVLRASASLRGSLWWLGFAGTLPFLGFFLYLERRSLIAPLRGEPPDPAGVERVLGVLLVWALGAVLAAHLSRILSRSILEPVQQVLGALERVRAGDLDVDATLDRRDEIGRLGEAVNGMADGLREQQRLTATFRRYMDARIAQHLLTTDVERGHLVQAVVMFSDLRGFTSLSETMGPERLVEVLNRYFSTIAPIVAAHGGVVDKYMGDGMLAVWGVPEPREVEGFSGWTDERLAVRAAIAMVAAVRALSGELGLGELRIGIGLHRGEVVAGPMGSREHREYTVVGDTVNTAQRIEGQARGAHAVLMSGAVAERLGGSVPLDALDPVPLKGKAAPLALFGVRPEVPGAS